MMTTINDINRYKSITVNPLLSPDQLFELYSVPSFDNQYPEVVTGKEIGSTKVAVQENDVLICKINPRINRVWVVKHNTQYPLIASSEWIVVRSPENDSNYLKWYFSSPQFKNLMVSQVTGIGGSLTRAQPKQVATYPVPLPDFPTQRRIANTLDKVSEGIGLCGRMMDELDLMVKAKFGEMFGDAHNNSAFPYKNIGDLTTVTSGGTPDRENNLYWDDGNIRWVKTTELQNCTICDTEEKITKLGLENSSAKLVPAGSVLIAMYGQGKTRGMTAYLENESATNQACACILPSSKINQKYLWKYLMLSYDKLRSMAKGGNQPNLNIGIIKNFPVLYPPIELQNQYVEFVIYIDKSILTIKGILAKMEEMKLTLMQKCFKEGKHGE